MKIIQSFWSGTNNDVKDNRGWLSYEYHWLGWILSCNQLRKFYDEVELYTDSFGYDILIEKLKLPYTKVHVVLDEMNKYPKDMWAIAKIKAYELQDKSFLHVDGDVFIWDKFSEKLMRSELITQNLENTTDYYREMWNNIAPNLKFIPKEINNYHQGITNLGCNMGIIGGNDIGFFKKYTKKSFEFVNKNKEVWNDFNLFNFNIFFEQQLFYEMSVLQEKPINYLFEEVWGDNSYLGLGNFQDIPHKRFYLHLLGNFKRKNNICKNLETYVLKEYPEFYLNLKNLISEKFEFFDKEISDYNFSKKANENLVNQFKENALENKLVINNENLLARNLFLINVFEKFEKYIQNNTDFLIVLLNCFEIEDNEHLENQENQNLKVKEFDGSYINHDFDEIDLLMIAELKNKINKDQFLINMHQYLEDDFTEDDLNEFNILLINRLRYFLECKIIVIFQI